MIVLSKFFMFYVENLFLPIFSIFLINVLQKIYFFSYKNFYFVACISNTFVSFKNIATVMTNKYKLTFNFLVEALKKIPETFVIFYDISYIR